MLRWAACVLALGACSVDGGAPPGGGPGSDAASASDAPGGGPHWIDAASGGSNTSDCLPAVTSYGDGRHNTGRDCFDSCHAHGFTLAGTLYTSATNNTGFAGATITIKDSQNQTLDVVVQANGNFYTKVPIAFPVIVMASACPASAKMTASVANGRCNSTACHAQSGGPAGQIHLP